MSGKSKAKNDAQRFGGEFGPYRKPGTTGVPLSTFKTLVWTSNIGGLVLVVLALEMLFVRQMFFWGLMALLAGVAVALFPSNYEIIGMSDDGNAKSKKKASKKQSLCSGFSFYCYWCFLANLFFLFVDLFSKERDNIENLDISVSFISFEL